MIVPGWTRAHGFFLVMGGFQLFERSDPPSQLADERNDHATHAVGRFVRILDFRDVLEHKLETIIPFVTEEEIKDKGKSDALSKFIVLLQTSWFIIQCIARGIKHLPLTELEIVTLAYAMLNLFVYIFWWDKPYNVGCPIRVYESLSTSHTQEKWETGFFGILQRVFNYVLGAQDQFLVLSQQRKVPMFWSGGVENGDSGDLVSFRAALGPSILGMAFGAIHCIAWPYVFPSHAELNLWRTSSIVMMAVPLICATFCSITTPNDLNTHVLLILIGLLWVPLLALSSWLYIAARIATIVMAFTTLRALPSEAFAVVDWTTFIPHI
jgi:hypothetical protein